MTRNNFVALIVVCCGSLLVAGCAHRARVATAPEVTFTKSVAPVLYAHCVSCHHPGGIGPMPLLTYAQAKPYSALIRDRVVKRIMPPWFADAPLGEFSNDPRLSEAEIHTITAWVDHGAPEGDPKALPAQPQFDGRWVKGQPDAVFSMAKEFTVPAHGRGVYAYFMIPTHFKEDKWVQTVQVLPSNPRIVHHASLGFHVPKPGDKFKNAGTFDAKYMYKAATMTFVRADAPVINDGCSAPWGGGFPRDKGRRTKDKSQGGDIATFLPGRPAEYQPPGYAIRIPAGAVLTLQMHYMPMGMVEKDRTRIGFWFAKGPVKEVKMMEVDNMLFRIPAGNPNVRTTTCYTFPEDVEALDYTIHMHYRGKAATVYAIYPDGKQETLLSIPHYNFDWQLQYILKHPKPIPKGTVIKTVTHFDNSRDNPMNPDPTKTIRWGEPSSNEMDETWIQFIDHRQKAVTLRASQ